MTATHIIGSVKSPFLDIQEDGARFTIEAKHPHSNGPGLRNVVTVDLTEGERIALAFAAIGGGAIDPTRSSNHITDLIEVAGSELGDDDLILVARKALRVLANRRKKRVSEERHVNAVLTAVHSLGLTLGRGHAKALVAAGVQVVK